MCLRLYIAGLLGQLADYYGIMSTFPCTVNLFLALRVLFDIHSTSMVGLRLFSFAVYVVSCVVNWGTQAYILSTCLLTAQVLGPQHLLILAWAAGMARYCALALPVRPHRTPHVPRKRCRPHLHRNTGHLCCPAALPHAACSLPAFARIARPAQQLGQWHGIALPAFLLVAVLCAVAADGVGTRVVWSCRGARHLVHSMASC